MGDSKDRARVGGKKTRDSVLKPHKGKKKAVEEKKIEETKDTAKSALSALIEQDGKVVEEVSASAGEQESESFSEEKTEDFEQSTEELDTTEAEEIEIPDTFSGMHPTEPVKQDMHPEEKEVPVFDDIPPHLRVLGETGDKVVDARAKAIKESDATKETPVYKEDRKSPEQEIPSAPHEQMSPVEEASTERLTPTFDSPRKSQTGILNYDQLHIVIKTFIARDLWCRERQLRLVDSIPGRKFDVVARDGKILASVIKGKSYHISYSTEMTKRFHTDDTLKGYFR